MFILRFLLFKIVEALDEILKFIKDLLLKTESQAMFNNQQFFLQVNFSSLCIHEY
jgi:hypothetical protein